MTPKRKKSVFISSDEEDVALSRTNDATPRSSQRLRRKSERSFVMPSRNEIWDTIPSESSKTKTRISKISPRKTVNDFTRVYNSYNFDDYEDTSNDESEDFLTDSSGGSHVSSDQKKCKSSRIKNYKRRLKLCSSSDDDDEDDRTSKSSGVKENNNLCDDVVPTTTRYSLGDGQTKTSMESGSYGDEACKAKSCNADCVSFQSDFHNKIDDDGGSDSDEGISPVKRRRRNASLLELESDSSSHISDSDVQPMVNNEKNTILMKNDSNESNLNDKPTSATAAVATCTTDNDRCNVSDQSESGSVTDEEDDYDSLDSGSSDYSAESDSDECTDINNRSSMLKKKKDKLFEKFKDIQKQRKGLKKS